MEKRNKVNAYEVRFYCEKCGKEVMFTGMINLSNPPKYKYFCVCGETYFLNKQYPMIDFERMDEDDRKNKKKED